LSHCTLNWVGDFSYDELEFEHVDEFAVEYESFFINDEPEDDVFDFDDACPMDFIADGSSAYDTSIISVELKYLLEFLMYAFQDPS